MVLLINNQVLALLFISTSFFSFCYSYEMGSCIRYETYQIDDYTRDPWDFSDHWFSHSVHYKPRKLTRMGIRTKRVYGCCETGYHYVGYPDFGCQPICMSCPKNSYCSEPEECTCNYGFHKDAGECISNDYSTKGHSKPTTEMSTTLSIPCNESCSENEICSISDDVCVCETGFGRQQESKTNGCIPICDPKCQNAECTAPNTCTCWPNYERSNNNSCKFSCSDVSCVYGECDNGKCVCIQDFVNNGTACILATDAILLEFYNCDCWSKFVWQKNVTKMEMNNQSMCLAFCDSSDAFQANSDCINAQKCQSYEGYLVCNSQIYKCIALQKASPTSLPQYSVLIISFLSVILFIGILLWLLKIYTSINLETYHNMRNLQDDI